MIQFSTIGILSGRAHKMDEPPVNIMADAPVGDHCCIYALPTNTSLEEFSEAITAACQVEPMSRINWPLIKVSPHHGMGTIRVDTAEELAILSEATIRVRGQPIAPKRVVQYKDSYAYILTMYDHVKVILDRTTDTPIPCRLMIGSTEAVLSGRKVESFCNYCRKSGHFKDKCPIRPGNKKHVATVEEVMDEAAPASNLPNTSTGTNRGNPKKSRTRPTKTAKPTKPVQPAASNKRARHDGDPEPSSPIKTPTSVSPNAQPFISGAANFGLAKAVTNPPHSRSGSSVSLSSLAAIQSAASSAHQPAITSNAHQPAVTSSAHQPAVTSSDQTGKYPTALSMTESVDSDIAMNSCENHSPAVTSTSVAPTAVTPSDSNAMASDSTDTAASSALSPAHQTRSHTKAQANVVMDATGNERLSVSEQRSSGGGSPQ
ncbi:hypothetical protein GGI24_003238 [Coemansia furcata]|nr:hypothetical protein GGI24_003238 [Coemansia furcata]